MSNQRQGLNANEKWPTVTVPPSDEPNLLIVFHGLFAFAYNEGTKTCEVGTHAKAPDHKFRVHVIEFEGLQGRTLYSFEPDSASDVESPIVVKVQNPTIPNVQAFQSAGGDDRDWSLVPDLEGSYFHKTKLKKKKKLLTPRIHIDSGTFYTGVTTSPYEFKSVPDDGSTAMPLGAIAFLPVVDPSPRPGGYVSLNIEGHKTRWDRPSDGKLLWIVFTNVCPGEVCQWDSKSDEKERRNDFYLFYRTFEKPSGHPEYELVLASRSEAKRLVNQTKLASVVDVLGKLVPLSTKDSPCGGIGFGQSESGLG